ncbi:MAG: NAD-binding protein [Pseudomonadota bacterium]
MSLGSQAIRLAYWLDALPQYAAFKALVYDWLVNPRSRRRVWFDSAMIVLILGSVFLLIYEAHHELGDYAGLFERFVMLALIGEYLARMWLYSASRKILIEHYEHAELIGMRFRLLPALWAVARSKLAYMAQPMAIIDLLAILPSYRPLGFLRMFLLFRLLKLFRYTRSLNAFAKVVVEKRFELFTLSVFVGSVVLISSIAVFLFETGVPGASVRTLMDAVYWAVITVTTVGYGDITPVTTEGRVVAMVLVFSGIGVISFATSIVVMAFHEKMRELHDNRVFSEVERLNGVTIVCGYGRIGQVVAQRLADAREAFVVIDKDEAAVARARAQGYLALGGDAADGALLRALRLGQQATRILCLTHDDVINVYITLTARQMSPDILVISRANKQETVPKLRHAGADHVVRPYEVVARMAAEFVGQPVAFDALHDVVTGSKGIHLEPLPVPEGSRLDGSRVGEIDFAAGNLLLFGVIRGPAAEPPQEHNHYEVAGKRFFFNPRPGFRLRAHDILVLIGYDVSLSHFRAQHRQTAPGWWRGRR